MAETVELPDEVKRFITTQLACFETPSAVAKAVKEDYAIEITRQRAQGYDPTSRAGKDLGAELKALFTETRAAYLAAEAEVGIAQPMFRLRMLEKMFLTAQASGNLKMGTLILEQAAKEVGGAFTNRRELSGPGGKPIETEDKTPATNKQQVLDELRGIFGTAVDEPTAEPAAAIVDGPVADAREAPADAPRSDPAVREGADGGGTAQPGAFAAGQAVAGEERFVLPADGGLQEEGS